MNPVSAVRERYWLHALLLVLTVISTSIVGAQMALDFGLNRPFLVEDDITSLSLILQNPTALLAGLPFSLTLLFILLSHEMGHYLTCRYYDIDASLPYFLPFPSLIGTLGAFIRIRSAIPTKSQLFDVGIAGPLAGFAVLLPVLGIGLAYSKIIPGIASQGDLLFGTPLLLRGLESLVFPAVPVGDIYLHPVARAAWVGILATALNLMPVGQLDGGHILYSFVGSYHRLLTNLFILALIPMAAFFSYSWLLWAVVLFLFGRRHPQIYDVRPMSRGRKVLGLLALVLFILCFSPVPIQTPLQ